MPRPTRSVHIDVNQIDVVHLHTTLVLKGGVWYTNVAAGGCEWRLAKPFTGGIIIKKQYLECGKIVSTHGIRGEVRVQPWCDSPEFLLHFSTLYLKPGEMPLAVEQARVHKNMVILQLDGYNTIDRAVTLRGKILYINREDAPEDEAGAFFVQDLLGISVLDADTGRCWGTLTDVIATGANDVYEITDADGTKRLIPVIPQVVLHTDLEAGRMEIRPLEGLFEDED